MITQIIRKCSHIENASVRAGWCDGMDKVYPEALLFEEGRDCRQCRVYPSYTDLVKIITDTVTTLSHPSIVVSPDRIAQIAWAIGELYAGREVQLAVWRRTPAPEGGFINGTNLTPMTIASLTPYKGESTQHGVARYLGDASPEALARYLLRGAHWYRNNRFFDRLADAFKSASIHPHAT